MILCTFHTVDIAFSRTPQNENWSILLLTLQLAVTLRPDMLHQKVWVRWKAEILKRPKMALSAKTKVQKISQK